MSETNNYELTQLHYITNGKEVEVKPIYDKNGKEVKGSIKLKGPEELKEEGYIVIQAETTRRAEREVR